MNVCKKEGFKFIEQLPSGEWVVRYGVVPAGHDSAGNELVSFASSVYPNKPTMEQIKRSIHRYAMAHLDDEEVLATVARPKMYLYAYY
jgi:hypothetical protein